MNRHYTFSMWAAVKSISRDLLDLAYPGRCVACGVAVDHGHRFCMDCDYALKLMESRPQCMECGAPVASWHLPCQRCNGRGYRLFDRMVRLTVFESPVRELITRFKYYHGWSIGELFAQRAFELDRVRFLLQETDYLVPVPLHPFRQIVRGFNQADVFARCLGSLAKVKIATPAIRINNTTHQAYLHSRERHRNMRGAFALLYPKVIENKRLTLVDDVFTTASTLKSLANTLRQARCGPINVLTIAMADPQHHAFEAV